MDDADGLLAQARAHPAVVDAGVAAVLVVACLAVSGLPFGGASAVGGVATLLVVGPLALRRTHPVVAAVAVDLAALAHLVLGVPLVLPADVAVLVALYSVTVHGPRWAHRTAVLAALVGSGLLGAVVAGVPDPAGALVVTVFGSAFALVTWAFGLVRGSRQETIAALRDRADRLEVERDQQGLIATAAERARIAREMHDIVAHSLSVIVAQADGGRYAAAADPGAATRALGTVAETGRAALADMRRLLGVLREEGGLGDDEPAGGPGVLPPAAAPAADGPDGGGAAPVRPLPGTADVEELVGRLRAGGLQVSLVRLGRPRALPPGAGLTVYRVVQEALTNVLKHAGPDPRVTVQVQWRPEEVVAEVSDDGRGAAADGAADAGPGDGGADGLGQGVVGMRERAAMFGGTVTAGPRPGGGFRVVLRLPTGTPPTVTPKDAA